MSRDRSGPGKTNPFDCRKCNDSQKREFGCSRHNVKPIGPGGMRVELPDGEVWQPGDCALNLLSDEDHERVRQFAFWRADKAWYSGGIGDMPCRYLAAMEVLADENQRIEDAGKRAKDGGA